MELLITRFRDFQKSAFNKIFPRGGKGPAREFCHPRWGWHVTTLDTSNFQDDKCGFGMANVTWGQNNHAFGQPFEVCHSMLTLSALYRIYIMKIENCSIVLENAISLGVTNDLKKDHFRR